MTTTNTVLSINERFDLKFITSLETYEKILIVLRRLGFKKTTYADLTKDNCGEHYPFSDKRKEVLFIIPNVTLRDAAFIQQTLIRL